MTIPLIHPEILPLERARLPEILQTTRLRLVGKFDEEFARLADACVAAAGGAVDPAKEPVA